jgi:hypothetical protein
MSGLLQGPEASGARLGGQEVLRLFHVEQHHLPGPFHVKRTGRKDPR